MAPRRGIIKGPPKQPRGTAAKPLAYKARNPPPPSPLKTTASEEADAESGELFSREAREAHKAQPVAHLVRTRFVGLFGLGAVALCLGAFAASMAVQWRSQEPMAPCAPGDEPRAPTGRPSAQSPAEFDAHLDKSEWRFGITALRRKLAAAARGHVLEVAIGTGRNLEFYDWDRVTAEDGDNKNKNKKQDGDASLVQQLEAARFDRARLAELRREQEERTRDVLSFTGLDIAPSMLDLALLRARQVVPGLADQVPVRPQFAQLAAGAAGAAAAGPDGLHEAISLLGGRMRIVKHDAQSSFPAPPLPSLTTAGTATTTAAAPRKYDTIIQTFGLCSVRDPVGLLGNMASSLEPETGRIVLLEHGRSFWDLVNGLLDRGAPSHFDRFGCWWNRDIDLIVEAAAQRVPGLEVVEVDRPGWLTLGTHVWVELKVRRPDSDTPVAEAAGGGAGGGSTGSTILSWVTGRSGASSAPKTDG